MATVTERIMQGPSGAGPQPVSPAVVCALNGSPLGRAAAAYAAALARALGWRLGLVASGLRPLALAELADALAREDAGIVVQPVGDDGSLDDAAELATRAGLPVVAIPNGAESPVMFVPAEAGQVERI